MRLRRTVSWVETGWGWSWRRSVRSWSSWRGSCLSLPWQWTSWTKWRTIWWVYVGLWTRWRISWDERLSRRMISWPSTSSRLSWLRRRRNAYWRTWRRQRSSLLTSRGRCWRGRSSLTENEAPGTRRRMSSSSMQMNSERRHRSTRRWRRSLSPIR
jgi:hypothetical protein